MGRIGRAHGVAGQVRIKAFTDDPLSIGAYGPLFDAGGRRYEIVDFRAGKDVVIARLAGIGDRTAAENLNGTDLYIDRNRLPAADDADTFYHADLVGLETRDVNGAAIGRVVAVHDFGAGDMLEVAADGRASFMVPFTAGCVPHVVIADGYVTLSSECVEATEDSEDGP